MTRQSRTALTTLGALRSDERGGIAILFAVALVALVGFAALAVDISMLYVTETRLQSAADLAALAGASELPDETAARATAIAYAQKNMPTAEHGAILTTSDVVTGAWAPDTRTFTPGASPANALRVTTRRATANGNPVLLHFAWALGRTEADVVAEATATSLEGQPGCILALDPSSKPDSLEFNSVDEADLYSCVPAANSKNSKAITINSVDSFQAGSLYSVGGYYANSVGDFDLDEPAQTSQPPLTDPYADLPTPSPGVCTHTNHNAGSSISPGVYCGGLTKNGGSLTVQPGTYYIVNGDLKFNSVNNITCNCTAADSGVTFVLTGTQADKIGTFDFNSINSVSLRAPAAVSYAFPGMLIYVDRRAKYTTAKFNSIGTLTFNGAVYAPSQQLDFNSVEWTVQTDCAQIIGFHVRFNSIDRFGRADNCQAYGAEEIEIGASGTWVVQ